MPFSNTQKKFLVPVKWDKISGTGLIEWTIPEEASLGQYKISWPDEKSKTAAPIETTDDYTDSYNYVDDQKTFGSFNIQEFKTANIKAEIKAIGIPWINLTTHKINFYAQYFSGGPAAQLPVKIKYSLADDRYSINDDDYENYRWLIGEAKEGVIRLDREVQNNTQPKENTLDVKLDKYGQTEIELKNLKYKNTPQRAVVSFEYKDANGDIQSLTRAFPLLISKYANRQSFL